MKKLLAIAVLVLVSGAGYAGHNHWNGSTVSHSGGTDAYGCHHDRKNGGYHCH